ncbi:hypothetical protein GCM10025331_86670 [Actinoplanes utahensis]|nr:hypothetical protein Aut01nite_86430 [Actinoplanes utahensis]
MDSSDSRNRKTASRIAYNELLDEVAQHVWTAVSTKTGPGTVAMTLSGRGTTRGSRGHVITAPGLEHVVSRTTLADLACRDSVTIAPTAGIEPLRPAELATAKRRRNITPHHPYRG